MSEKVHVQFEVTNKERFLEQLQAWTAGHNVNHGLVVATVNGYRADDYVSKRAALVSFVDQMEIVLRKHDNKTDWKSRPIEALVQFMYLEIEEFKLSYQHLEVSEARKELIDIANYAMIVHDRMHALIQDANAHHPDQPK